MRTLLPLFLAFAGLAAAGDVVSVVDWNEAGRGTLDLSRFLDAPAGKDGFVRVEGERMLVGDRRFRVWGINVVGGLTFPAKSDAEAVAADLARLGFNAVRFHHLDPDWFGGGVFGPGETTRRLDPERMDRFDYFVDQLRRRGVYFSVTLNVMRRYRPGDGVRDAEQLGLGKGATYFDPKLIELQEEFARQLLSHVNPYTGNRYGREPALCSIELVNENSLVESWMSNRLEPKPDDAWPDTWSKIPASYAEDLTSQWNADLAERHAGRLPAWRRLLDLPDEAPIPRSSSGGMVGRPADLYRAEADFLVRTEAAFFDRMKALIRGELDCPVPLIGSADHNDSTSGYPHVRNNARLDVVDAHGYWQHPKIGETTTVGNTPMVNDPRESTVVQFARTPVAGKPFTIGETNFPFPHQTAAEGYAIQTAYALLHDWDGIYWFSFGDGRASVPSAADGSRDFTGVGVVENGWFRLGYDPVKLAAVQACGLMWHRADVAPAKTRLVRPMGEDRVMESIRDKDWSARPYYDDRFDRLLSLVHATRVAFTEDDAGREYPPGPPPGRIVSDTGQLRWLNADQDRGLLVIDTPRTQALIGHAKDSGESTAALAADLDSDFAVLHLTSETDAPIAESDSLLLLHAVRATNTGFEWEPDGKTVKKWGTGPTVVTPAAGTVRLRVDAASVRVQPLAPLAVPAGEAFTVPVEDGVASFAIPDAVWSRVTPQ